MKNIAKLIDGELRRSLKGLLRVQLCIPNWFIRRDFNIKIHILDYYYDSSQIEINWCELATDYVILKHIFLCYFFVCIWPKTPKIVLSNIFFLLIWVCEWAFECFQVVKMCFFFVNINLTRNKVKERHNEREIQKEKKKEKSKFA